MNATFAKGVAQPRGDCPSRGRRGSAPFLPPLWTRQWALERYRGGSCTEGNLQGKWAQRGWSPWASRCVASPQAGDFSRTEVPTAARALPQPHPGTSCSISCPSERDCKRTAVWQGWVYNSQKKPNPKRTHVCCVSFAPIYVLAMSQRGRAAISWPHLRYRWHCPAGHSAFLKCGDTYCAEPAMCSEQNPASSRWHTDVPKAATFGHLCSGRLLAILQSQARWPSTRCSPRACWAPSRRCALNREGCAEPSD